MRTAQPPTIPFWLGEAPGRSDELSAAVSRLRAEIAGAAARRPGRASGALRWLIEEIGIAEPAAQQLVEYLRRGACGARLPADAGHARARALLRRGRRHAARASTRPSAAASTAPGAWRCASASAASSTSSCRRRRPRTTSCSRSTTAHSFELDDVVRYLHSASVRDVLIQALLDAPMFATRWRWVAGVVAGAAALPRRQARCRRSSQRMEAEDLIGGGLPRPDRLRREPRRASARSPIIRWCDQTIARLPDRGDGHRRPGAAARAASRPARSASSRAT